MNAEDRYILTGMLSDVKITNDIYFACEEGFLKPSELYELQLTGNYIESLIALFSDWYQNKATPEQQLLVDLNGYIHLNDQFDDLKTIIAVEIEKKFLSNEEDDDKSISELALVLEGDLGTFPYLPKDATPIRTENDIQERANIVYLLSCSDKRTWRDSVNSLLFRMRNNNYNGIKIKDALDWLIHKRNVEAIEYRESILNAYESVIEEREADYQDELAYEEEVEKALPTFVEKVFKMNKSKAEKYARKAISRGLRTLKSFIGDKDVRLFNTEEGFMIEAGLFNYRFRKSHTSLIQHTMNPISYHIPYDLIVVSKQTNLELANLCIYFDETPIIDQVISTVLFLQTGKEKEILETGNFFNRRDSFYTDPVMSQLYKTQRVINLQDYEQMVGEVTEIMLEEGESLEGYNEVSLSLVDVKKASRFSKIQKAVFDAMPNFIGAELPNFVYRDFENLTFDAIIDQYYQTKELSPELESRLRIC